MYLFMYVRLFYARMVKVSMLEIRTCLGPSACMYAQVCVCIHVRTLLCNLLFCSIWDKFKKYFFFRYFSNIQALGSVSEQSRSVWLERSLGKTAAQNSGKEEF